MQSKNVGPLTSVIDQEECPWDQKRLQMVASSPAEVQGIIAMLLRQGEETLAVMKKSNSDDKVTEWRKAAHNLRGSSSNLGMQRLAEYCKEDEASTSSTAARNRLMEGISAELRRIAQYKER